MPNTPVVISAGTSPYSMGAACQDGDSQVVGDLLRTVGYAVEVPEIYIDPVTGKLFGSTILFTSSYQDSVDPVHLT